MRELRTKAIYLALCGIVATSVFATPALAQTGEDASTPASVAAVVFDVTVLRPLGAFQSIVGVVLFTAVAPFAWPGGGFDEAFDLFIRAPYEDNITRPLGDF